MVLEKERTSDCLKEPELVDEGAVTNWAAMSGTEEVEECEVAKLRRRDG
jgi:hypothetical protein